MSWPADGLPRFITGEIRGGAIPAEVGGKADEYYVYDRAYCHHVVATFLLGKKIPIGKAGGFHYRSARHIAERRCEELNACQ